MSETPPPASNTVRLVNKIVIQGTIEQVWNELTKTDTTQKAFFDARLHTKGLEPGNKIAMRTKDGRFTSVVGEVIEIDPPHRYVISFQFTAYGDPPCRVIHELREVDGGVEYTLISEDVPAGSKTEKDMRRGGGMIVNTMKSVIETGRPSLGVRVLYRIFGAIGGLVTPKQCRSENWPV